VLLVAVAAPSAGTDSPSRTGASPGDRARVDVPLPMLVHAGPRRLVVLDEAGEVIARLPAGHGGFSLDGRTVARTVMTDDGARTVAHDVHTGSRLFGIDETLLIPLVLRRGNAIAFLGRGERDPYVSSLWWRDRAGRESKLVRFAFGTGTPGVRTGISEGYVMEYSFDRAAETVAVVAGNDYVDFRYDIWVVDVEDRTHLRLTKGQHSRFPAMSPDGAEVAYFREEEVCGGPMPGYRAGDLMVVQPDGSARRVLLDGTCDQYLDRPRWIDDNTIVAVSHSRLPGKDPEPLFDSQLVLVDAATGAVSAPISVHDRVGDVSVSPALDRVAYTNWTQANGFRVFHWTPGDDAPADPAAWVEGDTTQFDTGRVPHLRGDPTLITSY
jgi:hypothetical protein